MTTFLEDEKMTSRIAVNAVVWIRMHATILNNECWY